MIATLPRLCSLAVLALAAAPFLGCAVVETHPYHEARVALTAAGTGSICVATYDDREIIDDGTWPADFTGIFYSWIGYASPVTTTSGRPLAEDLTGLIVDALQRRGFSAIAVTIPSQASAEEAEALLDKCGAERRIFIRVNEWKSGTWMRTGVLYDLQGYAEQRPGAASERRATFGKAGREYLGLKLANRADFARQATPRFLKHTLEEFLNDPNVKQILEPLPTAH